jgi:nucleoside-diphosphate kinase
MESTFALIKPEAVSAGLVGEIIARFERAGLRLLQMRLLIPSRALAEDHYGEEIARKYGHHVREWLLDYVVEGPVVALVLSGPEAVRTARSLAGEAACPTQCAPGTIRADLGSDTRECAMAAGRALRNLIHTSDSPDAARSETMLWFGEPTL